MKIGHMDDVARGVQRSPYYDSFHYFPRSRRQHTLLLWNIRQPIKNSNATQTCWTVPPLLTLDARCFCFFFPQTKLVCRSLLLLEAKQLVNKFYVSYHPAAVRFTRFISFFARNHLFSLLRHTHTNSTWRCEVITSKHGFLFTIFDHSSSLESSQGMLGNDFYHASDK